MLTKSITPIIIWYFTLTEQGHSARYGIFGGEYYRQFLPLGTETPAQFPIRKINSRQYSTALKFHNLATSKE